MSYLCTTKSIMAGSQDVMKAENLEPGAIEYELL